MKFWTAQSLGFTSLLLFTTPAWAQATNPAANEEASFIAWILVGLVGGFLASKIVNKSGEGLLRDILLGIVGGIVGGAIFRAFGGHGVTGFNLPSIFVAFIGAIVVLLVYHAIRGQRGAYR